MIEKAASRLKTASMILADFVENFYQREKAASMAEKAASMRRSMNTFSLTWKKM